MACHNQPNRTDTVEGIAGPLNLVSTHYKRYKLTQSSMLQEAETLYIVPHSVGINLGYESARRAARYPP